MDAKKCDRCREYYNYNVDDKSVPHGSKLHVHPDNNPFFGEKSYDLCPECTKKLEVFLSNKKEDK